jgi:hypothetical protein
MPKPTCYEIYQAAFDRRQNNHPFDRVSAYKIRESRGNLHHELELLCSVQSYLATPKAVRRASQLVGCIPEDLARRVKQVPTNIAVEFGYNLVPAVLALTVEGVSSSSVSELASDVKHKLDALLDDCDAACLASKLSASRLYRDLRHGTSCLPQLCLDACGIANLAVSFCDEQGV